MALTKDYFDSIQIDIVKRKYYNANKVHAVLDDIQRQAEELIRENERLKSALAEKERADSSLISMQKLYRDTLSRAQERSDDLLRDTQLQRDRMLREMAAKSALISKRMEACLNAVKLREEQNIEFLNSQLKSFLSEADNDMSDYGGYYSVKPESDHGQASTDEEYMPPDLESKISRLAKEIESLES